MSERIAPRTPQEVLAEQCKPAWGNIHRAIAESENQYLDEYVEEDKGEDEE